MSSRSHIFFSRWSGGLLCLFGLSLFVSSISSAQKASPPRIVMALSANEVEVGERVVVEVQLDMPKGEEAEVYVDPSSTLKLLPIEGKLIHSEYGTYARSLESRTTTSYRYAIETAQTGQFKILPASIRYGGKTFQSNSVSILVRAKAKRQEMPNAAREMRSPGFTLPKGGPDVLIHAFSNKEQVWVGERIEVSWLLFAKTELIKYEPTPPSLEGLWSESLFEPSAHFDYSERKLATGRYVVSLLSKRALYATEAGDLSIAALSARIATLRTALGRYDRVSSNAVQLRVRALPSPAPQGFDPSYVGQFEMVAHADRTSMAAGQPFTLSLKVSGRGALGRLAAPMVFAKGYAIKGISDSSDESETNSHPGQRVFRYWVVPEIPGEQVFPKVDLHYFDSVSGTYKNARSKPIALRVSERKSTTSRESEDEFGREREMVESAAKESDKRVDLVAMLYWLALAIGSSLLVWLLYLRRRKK